SRCALRIALPATGDLHVGQSQTGNGLVAQVCQVLLESRWIVFVQVSNQTGSVRDSPQAVEAAARFGAPAQGLDTSALDLPELLCFFAFGTFGPIAISQSGLLRRLRLGRRVGGTNCLPDADRRSADQRQRDHGRRGERRLISPCIFAEAVRRRRRTGSD